VHYNFIFVRGTTPRFLTLIYSVIPADYSLSYGAALSMIPSLWLSKTQYYGLNSIDGFPLGEKRHPLRRSLSMAVYNNEKCTFFPRRGTSLLHIAGKSNSLASGILVQFPDQYQ